MEELNVQHVVTIYHNEANGYGVIKFITDDKVADEIVAVGTFGHIQQNGKYTLFGEYIEHPKYGFQLKVDHYETYTPNDTESLVRYFSSGLFPGIGRKTAEDIVDVLGDDAIEKIKEDATVLQHVSSLSLKKIESIIEGVRQQDNVDDVVSFLSKYGLSARMIMKIDATYKENAIRIVQEDPYRLMEDIDGIEFQTVDKLAQHLQFDMQGIQRSRAAVLSVLQNKIMQTGDSYLNIEDLKQYALKEFPFIFDFDVLIQQLEERKQIILEGTDVYTVAQYRAEKGIASMLHELEDVNFNLSKEDVQTSITSLEEKLNITYDSRQVEAMHTFFQSACTILTGGPGTGKTTIVKGIIELYRKFFPGKIIICSAPTGRAAKRLSELADTESLTIHSLLKWDLETNTFLIDDATPVEADLIIVDEFSMVDQWLFYHLLLGAKQVPQFLFIGDEDQLPSVGPGKVLQDLIESDMFSVVRLEKIFRQAEGSDVISLAHSIHENEELSFEEMKDVVFFDSKNYEVKDYIMKIVQNAIEKGYEDYDVQVLAPMYKGVAGIDTLNSHLQSLLNPKDVDKREWKVGYRLFREGDKLLQLKNQPDDNIYNGDIGRLVEIIYPDEDIQKQVRLVVMFDDANVVEFSGEYIYNLTHAYCVSIHKAQGSEYPIVIMPILSDFNYMLEKKLIYTGITRAKKSLVLLGDKQVLQNGIERKERHLRQTKLKQRIERVFSMHRLANY